MILHHIISYHMRLVGDDRGARVQRRAVAQRADIHIVALVAREELQPGLCIV